MNLHLRIPTNFSFSKLFYSKKVLVPFSVLTAFVFWLVMMISLSPVREQTFSDVSVSITLDKPVAGESNMGIVNDLSVQKFTVTVSGPNYVVSSLKADDFALHASAAEVTAPGDYSLEVSATRVSAKSGYSFVSIQPAVVQVTFDYIDPKEFTITPNLVGVGAADGFVAEKPIINGTENDKVKITGPRKILDTIDRVEAYAEVNQTLSAGQTFDAKLRLYHEIENEDGTITDEEISTQGLTLSVQTVKVTVPISKKVTVQVKPTFTNMPSGMTVSDVKYTVDYTTVTIIGPPDVVEGMSEVSLSAIDFTNISPTSKSFNVSATLPEGVKILEDIDFFTVTIDLSGYVVKTFSVSATKYVGLAAGLTAKSGVNNRSVKVCGPALVLNKLTGNDLYAEINLKDKSAGEHTVTAVIKSDVDPKIWQVGPYSTTVIIS